MTARLRLGILGDLHLIGRSATGAWHNAYDFAGVSRRLHDAVDSFREAGVDAVCLIGDLTHDGSPQALVPLMEVLAGAEVPILIAGGNHDPGGHHAVAAALPTAEAARAEGQLVGGWRIAGLQVISPGWFGARCDAPPAVHAWGQEPVVLLSHFPILSHAVTLADHGMPYPGDLIGRAAIARSLAHRDAPTIVVSGHIHARNSSHHHGVLQIVQAALVEPPYECTVLDITATEVIRQAIELPGPAPDGPVPVLVEAEQRFVLIGGAWQSASLSSDMPPVGTGRRLTSSPTRHLDGGSDENQQRAAHSDYPRRQPAATR